VVVLAGGLVLFAPASPAAASQYETHQDPTQKEMQERMTRAANKKRQEDIREDTEKLFQLATDLKAAVDKSNENMLSLDVVRKADEVEKLAKKVKEKMKDAVGQPINTAPPQRVPAPNLPR
jgi:type IV secretory pathway VirB4 component